MQHRHKLLVVNVGTEGTLLVISLCPSFSLFLNLASHSSSSAVIEHTNKVIYLEDDDVASVNNEGGKHALTTSHCTS